MYTSSYSSSSPVRTSTFGGGSTNYQHQPSNKISYTSSQTMDDGNTSLRRGNTAYYNSASSLKSISNRTTTPSQRYPLHNYPTFHDGNPYKSQPTSTRSYTNDDEIFHPQNSAGNFRSQSYGDLNNDHHHQSDRSHSSINNPSARAGGNQFHGQPAEQKQERDYEEDLIVKSTDLSASIEQQMIELVRLAFRKYDLNNQRELAGFLKRSADRIFSSCWHCIVGRQFSSYVTHEMNGFIYLTKGPLSILLFKSGS